MENEEGENENADAIEEIQETELIGVPCTVETDDNYESGNVVHIQVKGKYYKQTYRSAWEQMPDFKGWLRGVQGEPTRAYCTYCQKTLHAHRLSLLKHTCTIRHQKAAQLHESRKSKLHVVNSSGTIMTMITADTQNRELDNSEGEQRGDRDRQLSEMDDENDPLEDLDHENEDIDDDEEEDGDDELKIPVHSIPFQKYQKLSSNMAVKDPVRIQGKPPLSTHVLDTSRGTAVAGLQVSLYKLIDGRWTYINEGLTNSDGKFSQFIDSNNFSPGRYKLHYDVDRYFESKQVESLYPFIETVIDCRGLNENYHIGLLISPHGYSTFRGIQ